MGRTSLEPGSIVLGKYRIEQVLGRGGMGVVVGARHMSLDEVVAIKVLGEDVAVSSETFERFLREAKAAAKLRSQHVVRVTDVGRLEDGLPYMVMELLEGEDLRQLHKSGRVDPRLVITTMIQTCEALAEAHALGIVHRDIKPANLFVVRELDGTPFVKLLDFGIAKMQELGAIPVTRTTSMLGTPAYMSPEQLRSSRSVDRRTDLWALGVVMYELLEGVRPFDSELLSELVMQIALRPIPPPKRMPPALASIVLRCLEREPSARYSDAAELASALASIAPDRAQARRSVERIHQLVRTSTGRSDEGTQPPPFSSTPAPARGRLVATAGIGNPPSDAPTPPRASAFDAFADDAIAATVPSAAPPEVTPSPSSLQVTRQEGGGPTAPYATVRAPGAAPTYAARPAALSAQEAPDRFSAALTAAQPQVSPVVTQQSPWRVAVTPATITPAEAPTLTPPPIAIRTAAAPRGGGRRGALVAGGLALLLGGGAFAYTKLRAPEPQPDAPPIVAPASIDAAAANLTAETPPPALPDAGTETVATTTEPPVDTTPDAGTTLADSAPLATGSATPIAPKPPRRVRHKIRTAPVKAVKPQTGSATVPCDPRFGC